METVVFPFFFWKISHIFIITYYHIFLSFIVRNFEIISSDILGYFPFFRSIIQNYLVYPPPLTHFFLNYSRNLRIYLGCGDSGQTGETLSTYQKRRWVQLLYILNLTESENLVFLHSCKFCPLSFCIHAISKTFAILHSCNISPSLSCIRAI